METGAFRNLGAGFLPEQHNRLPLWERALTFPKRERVQHPPTKIFMSSSSRPSGPNWPERAWRSALARPRVEALSSRVAI